MTLLLPDPYLSDLRVHLCQFEGRIPWIYADGPGNITAGVGHKLPDFATACAIVPGLTQAEWDAVKAAAPNQAASAYRGLTKARMTEESMDGVLDTDISITGGLLGSALPEAQEWPGTVRQAIYDMGLNLGVHGLLNDFPHMLAAMRSSDWRTAAVESERLRIQAARNEYVYALIISAA